MAKKVLDGEDVIHTVRTMVRANTPVILGPAPSEDAAKALGMEIVYVGNAWGWTIVNEKRPEYVALSSGAYLASARRLVSGAQMVMSRNAYLRMLFRRARTHSLVNASPSQKDSSGWYPWLHEANPVRVVPPCKPPLPVAGEG